MTRQRQDTIIYKGEEQVIYGSPLDKYFEKVGKPNFTSAQTSMTVKGYYADWEIVNNKLFIIDFKGFQLQSNWSELEYNLNELFPDKEKPIFADWFSGSFLLPNGEDVSESMYPLYESFIKLTFDSGVLIKEEIEGNDPKGKTATNMGFGVIGAGR